MPTKKVKKEVESVDTNEDVEEQEDTNSISLSQYKKIQKALKAKEDESNLTKKQIKEMAKVLRKLTGDEKEDPNTDMKEYIKQTVLEAIKPIHERLDEREQEDSLDAVAHHFGFNNEQTELFEFKMAKLQQSRGDDYQITDKEVNNIANSVKKMIPVAEKKNKVEQKVEEQGEEHATQGPPQPAQKIPLEQKLHANEVRRQSSVVANNTGPSTNVGDYASMTVAKFNKMNPMEQNEFYKSNPKLYDKIWQQAEREEMDLGSKWGNSPHQQTPY